MFNVTITIVICRGTKRYSNNNQNLCDDFAKFFSDKITLIRENIQQRVQDVDSHVCEQTDRSTVQYTMDELAPTTVPTKLVVLMPYPLI